MARWQPDARERLVAAALDLFNERGYDETTVAQIAERAGLTKSTFFRHFPDKRDVLAAGQDAIAHLLCEGIATAPEDATPLVAVCSGLKSAAAGFTSFNRDLAPKLKAAIAASTELQERNALKQIGLAVAMAEGLQARGVPTPTAVLAAELGALAFKTAYARWAEPDEERDLGTIACAALHELRSAAADLG
jgi:AcrR family transcriptional regulator